MKDGRTQYQINTDGQLIVLGEWVKVSAEQQQQLRKFEQGIRYTVPKMVILATEGVDLATETVKHVYQNLVGQDSASVRRLEAALSRVQQKVQRKYVRAGDHYFIGPRSLENVDELMDTEIEQELDNAFNTTVGGLLSAIGGLSSDEAGHLIKAEQAINDFETMGAEIERQVGPQAQILRNKARWFCGKLQRLDSIEESLRAGIPQLAGFNIISTKPTRSE